MWQIGVPIQLYLGKILTLKKFSLLVQFTDRVLEKKRFLWVIAIFKKQICKQNKSCINAKSDHAFNLNLCEKFYLSISTHEI